MDKGHFTVEPSQVERSQGQGWKGGNEKEERGGDGQEHLIRGYLKWKGEGQLCFKAKVLKGYISVGIVRPLKKSISDRTTVFTDKSTSYVDISDYVEMYLTEKSGKESTVETLKWAYIYISNSKRGFLGNYHKIRANIYNPT